ncbi:efflux transporter outer membrane subunit [Aliamphritea hakodatensis]|uniref:efflux transporter outer membrane subunit n=1 Tax=Aliamphritea hakodatensis TaxID=2895352 RepID=UPI0022FD77AF|nr:efflux transporter outer membrane subunit [Aliamphritea hakodatensis]
MDFPPPALLIVLTLLLAGCTGSAVRQAPLTETTGLQPEQWATTVSGEQTHTGNQLLALVDDPQLDVLVADALKTNQQLQQTALRIREQRLLTTQTAAAEKPDLNLSLNSQRNKTTVINESHALALNLNWELDVWGRLANASSAAEADTRALQLDYQAARNSLTSRIIQRWIDISLRARIITTLEQRLESLQKTEATITERFQRGLGNLADLEAARASTARTRADLAARQQNQADAKRSLNVLLGRQPQSPLPLFAELAETHLAVAIPLQQLPGEVLAARPDLLAAYERIVAADYNTDVAYKALLPGFSLTASISQSRNRLSDLLSGSNAWSLLGSLTAPLFNAGRLEAGKDIAELQAERAYLAYQQTLLTAVQEVETALSQEYTLQQRQEYLALASRHSDANFIHYQSRYRDGLADILNLLTAEQQAFDDRIALLQIRQARLSNRIVLGLALGMGV